MKIIQIYLKNILINHIDHRVVYYELNLCNNPAILRNTLISQIQTKYICYCDDDDLWNINKLEKQITQFNNSTYDIIYTNYKYINNISEEIKYFYLLRDIYNRILTLNPYFLYFKNIYCFSSIMIKTEVLKQNKFDENPLIIGSEDYKFILTLINKYKIKFISDYLVYYRKHTNSISFKNFDSYTRSIFILKNNFNFKNVFIIENYYIFLGILFYNFKFCIKKLLHNFHEK